MFTHLMSCSVGDALLPRCRWLLGLGGAWAMKPPPDAAATLCSILRVLPAAARTCPRTALVARHRYLQCVSPKRVRQLAAAGLDGLVLRRVTPGDSGVSASESAPCELLVASCVVAYWSTARESSRYRSWTSPTEAAYVFSSPGPSGPSSAAWLPCSTHGARAVRMQVSERAPPSPKPLVTSPGTSLHLGTAPESSRVFCLPLIISTHGFGGR